MNLSRKRALEGLAYRRNVGEAIEQGNRGKIDAALLIHPIGELLGSANALGSAGANGTDNRMWHR